MLEVSVDVYSNPTLKEDGAIASKIQMDKIDGKELTIVCEDARVRRVRPNRQET